MNSDKLEQFQAMDRTIWASHWNLLIACDKEYRITDCQGDALGILNCYEGELIGRQVTDLFTVPPFIENWEENAIVEEFNQTPFLFQLGENTTIWVVMDSQPIMQDNGKCTGLLIRVSNESIDQKLQDLSQYLADHIANGMAISYISDEQGQILAINNLFHERLFFAPHDIEKLQSQTILADKEISTHFSTTLLPENIQLNEVVYQTRKWTNTDFHQEFIFPIRCQHNRVVNLHFSVTEIAISTYERSLGYPFALYVRKLQDLMHMLYPVLTVESLTDMVMQDREQIHLQRQKGTNDNKAISDKLTTRQKDVLGYIQRGYTNKQIARALNLQETTVKVHVKDLCKRLGVKNRTEAATLTLASN